MTHRVRTHFWDKGNLTTRDYFFDSLDQAVAFSHSKAVRFEHHIKVYNNDDQVVHEVGSAPANTYA
jgi:hypothetical protein